VDEPLPFFKHFYAGGIGSVRGFESGSLGPHDPIRNDALGGNKRLVANAEFLMPGSRSRTGQILPHRAASSMPATSGVQPRA
jgi:outer membrane protein assembly factor BamA